MLQEGKKLIKKEKRPFWQNIDLHCLVLQSDWFLVIVGFLAKSLNDVRVFLNMSAWSHNTWSDLYNPVYMIIINKFFLNNMCLDLNPEESPHGWTIVSNQLP